MIETKADGSRWWTGRVECSICGHDFTAVVEIGPNEDEPIIPLECSACGNIACQPEQGTCDV